MAVTDLELFISQFVKIFALGILGFGIIWNVYKGLSEKAVFKKLMRGGLTILFLFVSFVIYKWIRIEGQLLKSDKYTVGTTIGSCQVFAKGKAIEFEYELGNSKYVNCNTYHPVPLEDIIVPNGKYYVRYSEKYPEHGRMQFLITAE